MLKNQKKACLQYENMFSFENYSLLKIDLKTGETPPNWDSIK